MVLCCIINSYVEKGDGVGNKFFFLYFSVSVREEGGSMCYLCHFVYHCMSITPEDTQQDRCIDVENVIVHRLTEDRRVDVHVCKCADTYAHALSHALHA